MKKRLLAAVMALSILAGCKKEKPEETTAIRATAKISFEIISESNFNFTLLGLHPGPNTLVYSSTDGKQVEPSFSLQTGIGRWSTVVTAREVRKGDRASMSGSIMVESPGKKVSSRIYVDDKLVAESNGIAGPSSYGGEAKIDISYTF